MTSDPVTGTIPTGYLVWHVTDGVVKRHAGAYVREITVGARAWANVGLHVAPPTVRRASAAQDAVSYPSQTISDPPTQAQIQAVNEGVVAAIMLCVERCPA